MRVAVLFDNFGPYHIARLAAASKVCELIGIEAYSRSREYAWDPTDGVADFDRRVVLRETSRGRVNRRDLFRLIDECLSVVNPKVVAIPGWSSLFALLALCWCLKNRKPVVLMSESQAIDKRRRTAKELLKRRYVSVCQAALVGGATHRDYLVELGMASSRIFVGYDAVDNDYYQHGSDCARNSACSVRREFRLPSEYFLASNRFIPKKNLRLLVRAFARYRSLHKARSWELVLLGDGAMRAELESLIVELKLQSVVHLPGFRQYGDLPAYYGLAGAFVHASTSEQWGLVVNEAMASGLPVLVSDRCGCAAELLHEGLNGFSFCPTDEFVLADLMHRLASDSTLCKSMGIASRATIAEWGPDRFAQGLNSAIECAAVAPLRPLKWIDRVLMRILSIQ